MIKLICSSCSSVWYTANTKLNQKCSDCGGLLIEDILLSSSVKKDKSDIEKIYESKIIELEDYLSATV